MQLFIWPFSILFSSGLHLWEFCLRRDPVRYFYSFHWWSLPVPFLLSLLESPRQSGVSIPSCQPAPGRIQVLTLSLSAVFQPWCFSSLSFTPVLGALFLRSNSKPSTQSKQWEDALHAKESRVLTWWWGWTWVLVPAATLIQWLSYNWSPGICIQRR